jgi:hypothetical protein
MVSVDMKRIKETVVERHLVLCVKMRGGMCEKLNILGRRGPPDRLITWPDGAMQLVEVKKPKGGVLAPWQKRDHARRARKRVVVRLVWTKQQAEDYVMGEKKHWYGQILVPQCPENLVN